MCFACSFYARKDADLHRPVGCYINNCLFKQIIIMKGKEVRKEKKKEKADDRKVKKTSDYQKEKSGRIDIGTNAASKK